MNIRLFLLALTTAVALRAADSVPVFNATLTMGKEHRFVLVSEVGKTSSWLKLGDAFEGYTLKAFDAATSTLDLERDGKTIHVNLVGDAAVKNVATPTRATLADAEALLNKMHFEDLIEKSLAQQKKAMAAMVDQIGAQNNRPGVDKEDFVAFQKKLMDQVMSALNAGEMKNDVAKIYSEVFSKEEMDGLAAFYSTPTGEALIAKQPEVQQKMQAVVMPRIMAMMPKIQQMSKDFATEQKAKAQAAQGMTPVAPPPTAPPPGTP
jgi:uncharacterized protein